MTPLLSSDPRSTAPERVEGGIRLVTLPNGLSMVRVLLLPAILYLLERPDPESDRWAVALLLVAASLMSKIAGRSQRAGGA